MESEEGGPKQLGILELAEFLTMWRGQYVHMFDCTQKRKYLMEEILDACQITRRGFFKKLMNLN